MRDSHTFKFYYKCAIKWLRIISTEISILEINFVEKPGRSDIHIPDILQNCINQLSEYFAGKRKIFDLNLSPQGTDFQKKVWDQLEKIPFGKTVSYGDVARAIKNPKGVRAVGGATGRNNIAIIIPCHRVIGSDGSLTGFGGGMWRKIWLLEHEQKYTARNKNM